MKRRLTLPVFVRMPLVDTPGHLIAGLDNYSVDFTGERGGGGGSRHWST